MLNWAKWIQSKVQPEKGWPLATPEQFIKQRELQALWIGIIAFVLPLLLFYANVTAPCFRDSISHSYYIPFWGDVFVALTTFVGIFLLFYRGQSRLEGRLARLAGISAIIVALIPTSDSGCENTIESSRLLLHSLQDNALSTAFDTGVGIGEIHLIAAGILFLILAVFNLFVFTATDQTNKFQKNKNSRNKRWRNKIYKGTGLLMVVTLIALAIDIVVEFNDCNLEYSGTIVTDFKPACSPKELEEPSTWDKYNFTFAMEWVVLFCFSTAWIVKGRAGGILLRDDKPDQIITPPHWWVKRFS